MQNQTDLSKIDDLNVLKALAYDRGIFIKTAQEELALIEVRIRQVFEAPKPKLDAVDSATE